MSQGLQSLEINVKLCGLVGDHMSKTYLDHQIKQNNDALAKSLSITQLNLKLDLHFESSSHVDKSGAK